MKRRNTAQQIYHALGVDLVGYIKHKSSSFTEKSSERKHQQGKKQGV